MTAVAVFSLEAAWAANPHVVVFGRWASVKCVIGTDEEKVIVLKMRSLIVDGKVKESVVGASHEVTDRLFVVQRLFRINASLPEEQGPPRWQWQRGGWLLVDRMTGRISAINLPEFDVAYSTASWFRDYAAYCGVSEDGKKAYAVVAQLNRRKAVVKNLMPGQSANDDRESESGCGAAAWQRSPIRVTFQAGSLKQTYAIRGHVVDLVNDVAEDEEGSK